MIMEKWRTIAKALLIVALPVTGLWLAEARKSSTELQPGSRLPEIALESVNDLAFPSYDNGLPKAIVIFSASCPFCREQLRRCRSLAKEWSGRIDVVAVSSSDRSPTVSLLQEMEIRVPAALAQQEDTWKQWHVTAVPTTILLDPRRIVVNSWKGVLETNEERKMYERLAQTAVGGDR
jgi:peroxiredoxin